MARDAIRLYIESLVEDGVAVPVEEELIESRLTVEAHA
jgi:predicted RNase H-like HicB family nuclease